MPATTRVITLADVPDEVAQAVQPVIQIWEAAALRVASNPGAARSHGSVEEILDEQFRRRPKATQELAAAKAVGVLTDSKFPRRLQRQFGANLEQVSTDSPSVVLKFPDDLRSRLQELNDKLAPAAPGADGASETTYDFVALQVRSLRCVDETNGFGGSEWGSDEISIGGTLVDSDGNTGKVQPVDLGGDWDDGDVQRFKPEKQLLRYSLRGGRGFPQAIFVTLALAERDGAGGFQQFIDAATDKIAEQAKTSLAAALGAAAGSAGGPAGTLIGLAVGYAIGKIVEKIKASWADDLFTPVTIELNLPSRQSGFGSATPATSSSIAVVFTGPGEYRARYQWQLVDEA